MRSLIPLVSVLLTLLAPASADIECDPADDECIVQSLIQEDLASFVPLGTLLNIDPNNVTEEEEPTWECDLRAWTRAPDLSPGSVIPAEARLAVNGSACGDVVKWEVGLRYKERAIIKRKRSDVEFPKEPKRAPWNATRHEGRNWNDVFAPTHHWFSGEDREYEEALNEYNRLMSDEALWELRGHERVVFDIKKEMQLDLDSITDLDTVKDFAIHVPLTNFPPVEDYALFGTSFGEDEQMLGTDSLSEHYHLVHLANGTIIDIPSGRSGFIPLSSPASPPAPNSPTISEEIKWPVEVSFPPTKRERDPVEDPDSVPWFDPRIAPECDKGNAANFTLLISSNITRPTIGHNVTFNMTLVRTGNGSEYPAYIDIYHGTDRNVTYAWDYVTTEEDYLGLVSSSGERENRHSSNSAQKMLMTPTMEALERDRKRRECWADGPMMTRMRAGIRGLFPVGDNGARYEFWNEDGLVERDEYEFGVELPIHYRDFPSFVKTFETFRSQLQFSLYTAFSCDVHPDHESKDKTDEEEMGTTLDDEWREYQLPIRKKKQWGTDTFSRAIYKPVTTPFDARLPVVANQEEMQVVHYLDSTALGPVITDANTLAVDFPLLNQELREEDKEERVKRQKWKDDNARSGGWCRDDKKKNGRWGNAEPNSCWELNGGGGSHHAGRMWQAREARREGKEVGRRESMGGGMSGGIVFQS